VRLLPSAKVCFLGGCPQSGRNQNLHGRNKRSRRPQSRRAQPLFRSRCLRAMGEKGKGVATNSADRWAVGRRGEKLGTERTFGLSHGWRSVRRRVRTRGNLRLTCCHSVATRGIADREERVGAARKLPKPVAQENAGREKFAYRRGEKVSRGKRDAVLRQCRSARSRRRTYAGSLLAARRGAPPFRIVVAAAKMRAAL
jgi:hypothetical protein